MLITLIAILTDWVASKPVDRQTGNPADRIASQLAFFVGFSPLIKGIWLCTFVSCTVIATWKFTVN
jgi:hypothetical protein